MSQNNNDNLKSDFRAKDISLQVQKKLFGKIANKNVVKVFVDDTSANLLDNMNRVIKFYSGDKKVADKIIKNIIKIIIKMGVLYRNDKFSGKELDQIEQFKSQLHSTIMTIVSFHQVEFSYDQKYVIQSLEKSKRFLIQILEKHLTPKSINRIEHVFGFFTDATFMDAFFRAKDGKMFELRANIMSDINTLIENGAL